MCFKKRYLVKNTDASQKSIILAPNKNLGLATLLTTHDLLFTSHTWGVASHAWRITLGNRSDYNHDTANRVVELMKWYVCDKRQRPCDINRKQGGPRSASKSTLFENKQSLGKVPFSASAPCPWSASSTCWPRSASCTPARTWSRRIAVSGLSTSTSRRRRAYLRKSVTTSAASAFPGIESQARFQTSPHTTSVQNRGLQTFLSEDHTSYYTTVRGPDTLLNVIVSGYVAFYQINKSFVNIFFIHYWQNGFASRI